MSPLINPDPLLITGTLLYTSTEARAHKTFLALMWALSYPGRLRSLAAADPLTMLATIGEALLDRETTYYTPDVALAARLTALGARSAEPDTALYHFYPDMAHAIDTIAQATVGDALYPDQAATVFIVGGVGQPSESTQPPRGAVVLTLQGPGINGTQDVWIDGVPESLWTLRNRRIAFPLGWDMFIVDLLGQVVGVPRSTQIV